MKTAPKSSRQPDFHWFAVGGDTFTANSSHCPVVADLKLVDAVEAKLEALVREEGVVLANSAQALAHLDGLVRCR